MPRYRFTVDADLPDDVTTDQLLSVLGDCVVQVEEPVLERRDDGNDLQGTSSNVCGSVARLLL